MATTAAAQIEPGNTREAFRAPARKWWQAAAFLFLLSMVGLQLYPVYLLVFVFLIWRWRHDRYAFMVELMIMLGAYGFIPGGAQIIPIYDVCTALGIIGAIVYRKNRVVKAVTVAMLAYFTVVVLIALTSAESLSIQFFRMRRYFMIIAYFIPLLVFVNRPFAWSKFRETLVIHVLVICGFYIVDTFIIGGYILLPGLGGGGTVSSIFEPYLAGFMSMPRHYPAGLYWLVPCVIWLNYRELRFSPIQWIVIALALFASRTNSLLFALVACWIFIRPEVKKIFVYAGIGAVALAAGYIIDNATGRHLRLADNFDQFTSLEAAQDDEDIAEFGSGRMAQILPKWELLQELDRMALGFGFLHPEKTTNPIFQIHNDLYTDESQADEVAIEVEVTQVQTIFHMGFVGLFCQTLFYVGIYFIIRRLRYSKDYLNVLLGASVLGIGGFAGLNGPHGLILIGIVLGSILLANKPISLKQYPDER